MINNLKEYSSLVSNLRLKNYFAITQHLSSLNCEILSWFAFGRMQIDVKSIGISVNTSDRSALYTRTTESL